ncbi:MAG: alanyl-tRNA editing protein [Myxococcales bacterium]|nr:alanyl-tRNA editing protein [Myxococcales bacterium]
MLPAAGSTPSSTPPPDAAILRAMDLLRCHEDAFLRALDTEVLACEPADDGHHVALADSILFPGGGGQPDDRGTIGDAQVIGVAERDGRVWYVTDRAVPTGPTRVEVDWARRFDYMQQHTAQHLLTALALRHFKLPTLAFHLNPERSDVVLDAPRLDAATIDALEARANEAIREAHPVQPRLIDPAELDTEGVRRRRLPPGHEGALRVVEIEGIDLNTCGGTHVSNTAQLQMIRLIGVDFQRGEARLHYLAGGRVLAAEREARARTEVLNRLLSGGPESHVESVERLLDQARADKQSQRALVAEIAGLLGAQLASGAATAALHREGADLAFLGAVAQAARAARSEQLVLLTAAPAGSAEGVFLLAGPPERVTACGPAVAEALAGRGGGRGDRYQGKATRLDRRDVAFARLA